MDFETNKILAAVFATLLLALGLKELSAAFYPDGELDEPAYVIEVPDAAPAKDEAEAPVVADLGTLLAEASATAGERVAKKCVSCHSFEKGGANGTGPNLWGAIGRTPGSKEGYTRYSGAIQAIGEPWSYEMLNGFLENPTDYLPGTNMRYQGLKKPEDRAKLLAYLQTLSDAPVPFPEPAG
ncbi:MAG: cytochrome c family protein [Pseudomonadota bacterium]